MCNDGCRVTVELNGYLTEIEVLEEQRSVFYDNPHLIEEAINLNKLQLPAGTSREDEFTYWEELMLEIGDAHRHDDYRRIGELLAPHISAYRDDICE